MGSLNITYFCTLHVVSNHFDIRQSTKAEKNKNRLRYLTQNGGAIAVRHFLPYQKTIMLYVEDVCIQRPCFVVLVNAAKLITFCDNASVLLNIFRKIETLDLQNAVITLR